MAFSCSPISHFAIFGTGNTVISVRLSNIIKSVAAQIAKKKAKIALML